MSVINPESRVFQVVSGRHKGRACVVIHAGAQITESAKIAFLDNDGETAIIDKGELAALDMPGWVDESVVHPYGLSEYLLNQKGNGSNLLREKYFAQPRTLNEGDVLAIEEAVMEKPRRGFNSSTLIRLSISGWVELAPRLPIALRGNGKFRLPVELTAGNKFVTGCRIVKKPFSLEVGWTSIFLDTMHCGIEVPSCIPLALA